MVHDEDAIIGGIKRGLTVQRTHHREEKGLVGYEGPVAAITIFYKLGGGGGEHCSEPRRLSALECEMKVSTAAFIPREIPSRL